MRIQTEAVILNKSRATSPTWRGKFGMAVLFILMIVVCFCFVYVVILHGPLGNAKIINTDSSCGTGEYRVVVYQYENGDGYFELTNRANKVLDLAKYSRDVDFSPFNWDENCQRVAVNSNDGLVYLKAK